jgi:hypothetical protein
VVLTKGDIIGYGQAEVARYLNITASAIAKVRKKFE